MDNYASTLVLEFNCNFAPIFLEFTCFNGNSNYESGNNGIISKQHKIPRLSNLSDNLEEFKAM